MNGNCKRWKHCKHADNESYCMWCVYYYDVSDLYEHIDEGEE